MTKTVFNKFIVILICTSIVLSACKKDSINTNIGKPETGVQDPSLKDNDNLLMGNPSEAVANENSPNNYLMVKEYFTLSYNRTEGKANWVSWHLQQTDIGAAERQDDFRTDNTLPATWYWVKNTSYANSGFDRGHYCPSADRTATITANSATFVMTNMMPQAPNNNQRTWSNLEAECRRIVADGNEAYIIAGSYGSGGIGSKGGITYTIDNANITVPSNTWKVVLILPKGDNDLKRVNSKTRVISVNMPNHNDIQNDWKQYRTTVRALEAATGYNLLSNLPIDVQSTLETKIDSQ